MKQNKFITYITDQASLRKQLRIFWIFFIIGLFTFGGGYSMILFIKRYCVEQYHWLNDKEFYDMLVIAEITPGPISVNLATFVGYREGGVLGSVLATLGVAFPAVCSIIIIAVFFPSFQNNVWVQRFFSGIIVGIVALITTIIFDLGKRLKWTIVSAVIYMGSMGILFFNHKVSPIWLIVGGCVVGLVAEVFKLHGR